MNDNLEVLNALADWDENGQASILATVVSAWGSAPRRPGSQMLVREDGHVVGSVSGGCVEGDVIAQALEMLSENNPENRASDYGIDNDSAWAVGLACGGQIRVHLHRPLVGFAARTLAQLEGQGQVRALLALPDQPDFAVTYAKPLRLLIVGGVHIAQALVHMAPQVAMTPTVIDPRQGFASQERFPNIRLLQQWPSEAVVDFKIDNRTAVVALTHDEKIDDPALLAAFASPAFYIGALGSKRTQESRRLRLLEAGVSVENYARLSGPIGLDIGAANPSEIAVSILAEIVQTLRKSA